MLGVLDSRWNLMRLILVCFFSSFSLAESFVVLIILTWLLAIVGHIGIWCVAFNRTHATALPRRWRKWIEKAVILMVVLPAIVIVWTLWRTGDFSLFGDGLWNTSPPTFGYALGCLIISPYFIIPWFLRKFGTTTVSAIRSHQRRWAEIDQNAPEGLMDGQLGNGSGEFHSIKRPS